MLNHVLIWEIEIYIYMFQDWVMHDLMLEDRREKSCMLQLFLHFPPSKTAPVKLLSLQVLPQDNFSPAAQRLN